MDGRRNRAWVGAIIASTHPRIEHKMNTGEARRKSETFYFTCWTGHENVQRLAASRLRVWEVAMETITVASTRGFALSEMEILIGSAIVIAAIAWMVLSGLKHFRSRHEPRV